RPGRARRAGLAAAGVWPVVTAARSAPADPVRARERHRVRTLAQQRAAAWLARAHPDEYRDCYAQALERIRAQASGLPPWRGRAGAPPPARADPAAPFSAP